MPQPSMFEVESNFYRGAWTTARDGTGFKVPKSIFTSSHLIITERLAEVQTHKCLVGCPAQYILPNAILLAKVRACCRFPMHLVQGPYRSYITTGTLPNIRNTLNKKSTRHSGPRIAANSGE